MSHPHLLVCRWCGSPYNGGNCPSCGMVEPGNGSVYNQNPYSYHDTTNSFHQLPHRETQQFYYCEYCGGPHYISDCQTRNQFIYEQVPCNNHEFGFNQPSQYTIPQPFPQDELARAELITKIIITQTQFNKNIQDGINCLQDLILRKQKPPADSFYLEVESDADEPFEEENSKELMSV